MPRAAERLALNHAILERAAVVSAFRAHCRAWLRSVRKPTTPNTGMNQYDSYGRQLLAQMERREKEPTKRRNQQKDKTDKNTLGCRVPQQDRDQQEMACRAESRMQQGKGPGSRFARSTCEARTRPPIAAIAKAGSA